jgi:hypothetical protein
MALLRTRENPLRNIYKPLPLYSSSMKFVLGILFSLLFLGSVFVVEAQVSTKKIYAVEVREFYIPPLDLQCQTTVNAIVQVYNRGNVDATVYAEVANDVLGITEFSPSLRIQSGRRLGITVPFALEEEVQGAYNFDIRLYTEEGIQHLIQTVHFQGCPKETLTSLITSPPPTVPSSVEADEEEVVALLPVPIMLALGLLGLLAFLSVLFIFTAYFKNYHE